MNHQHQWQGGGHVTTTTTATNHHHRTLGGGGGGGGGGSNNGPCGACKYLRRKCVKGCVFAPYFDSDQGTAHFAAVHKVFGASNAAKLLLRIPTQKRLDAVVTLCYEALSRVRDPVYGCVSHIFSLQQQVLNMQAELALVQARISNLQCLAPPLPTFQVDPNPNPNTTPPTRPISLDQISSSSSSTPLFDAAGINSHPPPPPPPSAAVEAAAGFGAFCNQQSDHEYHQHNEYDQENELIIEDGDLQTLTREFVSKYLPGVRFKSEPH